jgi:hypothetical protein
MKGPIADFHGPDALPSLLFPYSFRGEILTPEA